MPVNWQVFVRRNRLVGELRNPGRREKLFGYRFGRFIHRGCISIVHGLTPLVPQCGRHNCVTSGFLNGNDAEFRSRRLFQYFHVRPLIDDDRRLATLARLSRVPSRHYVLRVVDDGRIVHDHGGRAMSFVKVAFRYKNEGVRSHGSATRRTRRPSDITATLAPANPGRFPLGARNPAPSIIRIINPSTIVIARPCPRFITLPIPATVGPNPSAVAVWPPFSADASRVPASSVSAEFHPGAICGKWSVKIGGSDFHPGRNPQICEAVKHSETQAASQNECQRRQICWATFHKHTFVDLSASFASLSRATQEKGKKRSKNGGKRIPTDQNGHFAN